MNLRELSEKLGLSQTTVSRALNGYPEVGAKTRKRVLEAAKAHGYAPSTAATMLATGRTRVIGHIVSTANHDAIDPHFADFLAGASETYTAKGYDMMLSMAAEGEEVSVAQRLKQRGLVDGVVVQIPRQGDPRVTVFSELGLPYIFHGRTAGDQEPDNWMDIDNAGAFERAATYIIERGHRRIALFNGPEHLGFAIFRARGYRAALAAAGVGDDPHLHRAGPMNEHTGYSWTREMLDLDTPPTALLCSSTLLAVGARRALRDIDTDAARRVEIVCHDDCLSFAQPQHGGEVFTATRSSIRAAGARVAEMIIELAEGKAEAPYTELWDAPLIPAGTAL